jgi:hypothetical protein
MDEIDSMNNGDKGGLTSLIKLMRCKKTKKQKHEDYSLNPVICIGNYHFDKKTTELKRISNSYNLLQPTNKEVGILMKNLMIDLYNNTELREEIINYICGDLRKINQIHAIYKTNKNILTTYLMQYVLQSRINNEFSKDLTKNLINNKIEMSEHNILINETDRTSISLLFHENIIDMIYKNNLSIDCYREILDNYCYADYLDRVTFQKQIWIFNELTSLMKTIFANNKYHDHVDNSKKVTICEPVRFTKVLTKYSTEYNNQLFINNICTITNMDRQDVTHLFLSNLEEYNINPNTIIKQMNEMNISKLELDRMFRFIKNIYE